MMILIHIDWAGTEDQLKALDEVYKKAAEKTDGCEYKARLTPWNKKYHYTYVMTADDITKFHKFGEAFFAMHTRDRSLMTHGEYEFYR